MKHRAVPELDLVYVGWKVDLNVGLRAYLGDCMKSSLLRVDQVSRNRVVR